MSTCLYIRKVEQIDSALLHLSFVCIDDMTDDLNLFFKITDRASC